MKNIMLIIVILVIYIVITYNSLVKASNLVKEAFATMDVYLKKRWDLIPNLVASVKGYVKHEKGIFEKIIELRGKGYENISKEDKIELNKQITKEINNIMVVIENYPELKASSNFLDLSKKLTKIEDDIANARKYYNGAVKRLNDKIQMFPSIIVAKIFKFKVEKMFEINDEEKENVNFNI